MRIAMNKLAALASGLCLLGTACNPVIRVTSKEDGAAGSLRAAISEANRATSPVRIELPSGTYDLTLCGSDDDNANGDLDVTSSVALSIVATGPDVTIRQTCAGERVLEGRSSELLTLTGVTLTGGSSADSGGAIKGNDVALTQVTLTHNTAAGSGGGIQASTLTADDVTISDNAAGSSASGGGIAVSGQTTIRRSKIASNSAGRGAGIASIGALILSDTSVTDNTAFMYISGAGVPLIVQTSGGGILADTLDAERVTIANNTVNTCGTLATGRDLKSFGAALNARVAKLVNTTITGNGASSAGSCFQPVQLGPGGSVFVSERLSLEQVTLNGDVFAATLTTHRSAIDACASGTTVAESSYNWSTSTTCGLSGVGDRQESVDWMLGPLQDNGGVVATRVPAAGSVLIDAVPTDACLLKSDARGAVRPQGAGDIGAVEAM